MEIRSNRVLFWLAVIPPLLLLALSVGIVSAHTLTQSGGAGVIVYGRVTASGAQSGTVWMMNADGSDDHQVTVGQLPRLSPDGNWILVHRGDENFYRADVYVHSVVTGGDTLVFPNYEKTVYYDWISDSEKIVYDYDFAEYVSNRDGSAAAQLYPYHDPCEDAPAVRRSDERIALHHAHCFGVYEEGLYLVNVDHSGVTLIPNSVSGDIWPQWSPNGQWLSFANGDLTASYSLYKIKPNGSSRTELLSLAGLCEGPIRSPAVWTADNSKVVFAARIGGVDGLYAVAADGSKQVWRIAISDGPAPNWVGNVTGNVTGAPVTLGSCGGTATPTPTTAAATPTVTTTPCAQGFNDVHSGDYFYAGVYYLVCHGAVSGYEGGVFRPYNNTTRAQLVKIDVLANNIAPINPSTPTFSDVPTTFPFYGYIEAGVQAGVINGYSQAAQCAPFAAPCFHPYADITRGQVSKIVVLTLGWAIDTTGGPHFSDVHTDNTFYSVIETAFKHGVISGYADGTFKPNNNATRGQLSKMVYQAVTGP